MTSRRRTTTGPTVLVSGAGISGLALAYWLHRAGFTVTVVEKAAAPRDGGYPIDVRGTAIEVVRRMGLLARLREVDVDMRRWTFLDVDGSELASFAPRPGGGGAAGQDLEVRRGDLTGSLYASVRDDVELRFDSSVDTLEQSPGGVDVRFRDGHSCTFDLVVGADGTHSSTRRRVFGPEERFHRHLGYGFAIFTMPNVFGLSRELVLWNAPGRAVALYAVGDDELHAFLNFHHPRPASRAPGGPSVHADLVTRTFAGAGWEVPTVLDAMHLADDVFLDTAGQVRMPRWSTGRVALVGDAAYAPSFLTGQGSSVALVGAYVLADALATHGDHTAAFAAYERRLRPFVDMNQALVDHGAATLFPTTAQALEQRNAGLRGLTSMPSSAPRPAHTALVLPEATWGS